MRGREHGEVDLQHGAKHVVMTMQRGQKLRRALRQIFLAGFQLRDRADEILRIEVIDTDRTTISLTSPKAAYVDLVVRWSRWLSVDGPACLEKHGSWTRIRFTRAGSATVSSKLALRPHGHC